jgi:hypothetical protein
MDVGSLMTALAGARTAQLQFVVAAKMLRMSADQASNVAKMIEAAQQNIDRLANVAAGVGGAVDISL